MSVTQTCRDINELTAGAKQACMLLFQECYKAGIKDIFITETYRSQARQNYLYEQGRSRPGNVVTWTRNSNHTPRLAFDLAVAPPKNLYDTSTLNKVGAIAKKLNIEWGGYWKAPNYDAPHFQVDRNWKIPSGYKLDGLITPSINSKIPTIYVPANVDYSTKIGYRDVNGTAVYRLQTAPYIYYEAARQASIALVNAKYLSYGEVFGDETDKWRIQSGAYKTKDDATTAAKKLIDDGLTTYVSVLGFKN